MSTFHFSSSEVRFATAALAAASVLLPTLYFLRSSSDSSSNKSTKNTKNSSANGKALSVTKSSSPHLQTFNHLLHAYTTLRPAALGTHATSSFTHTVLPLSLGVPPRNLASFQHHATLIFGLFADFRMEPQGAVHVCTATNTVIAHCRMGGTVNKESEKGRVLVEGGIEEWWTECVLFVEMSGDGRRVEGVREFVDSGKAGELQEKLSGILSR